MSSPPDKVNPFKPAQPAIPGVPLRAPEEKKETMEGGGEPAAAAQPETAAPAKPMWQSPPILAGAAFAALVLLAGSVLAWRAMRPAPPPAPIDLSPAAAPSSSGDSAAAGGAANASLRQAPGPVATVEELAKPWSVVRFEIQRPTGENAKGMVIRLPATPSYWGLLTVPPYGQCEVELETDVAKLRQHYRVNTSHPMVVDSCTQTVYDPMALGSSGGVWIRGRIVAGAGLRPPFEVEIIVQNGQVIASRSE